LSVGIVVLICGGWILDVVLRFTNEIFGHIQNVGP
jgi:flagellar biosynthesis protein FliQ